MQTLLASCGSSLDAQLPPVQHLFCGESCTPSSQLSVMHACQNSCRLLQCLKSYKFTSVWICLPAETSARLCNAPPLFWCLALIALIAIPPGLKFSKTISWTSTGSHVMLQFRADTGIYSVLRIIRTSKALGGTAISTMWMDSIRSNMPAAHLHTGWHRRPQMPMIPGK